MPIRPRLVASALLAVAAVAAAPLAAAASYTFTQGGYSGGGVLSGSFSGVDVDGDGWLAQLGAGGELSAFALGFAGDAQVAAFTLGAADLQGLVLRLDGGPLGDDASPPGEGLAAASVAFQVLAGWSALGSAGGLVADLQSGASSLTELPVVVMLVPEPGTMLLLGAGAGAMALRLRRRSGVVVPSRSCRRRDV